MKQIFPARMICLTNNNFVGKVKNQEDKLIADIYNAPQSWSMSAGETDGAAFGEILGAFCFVKYMILMFQIRGCNHQTQGVQSAR